MTAIHLSNYSAETRQLASLHDLSNSAHVHTNLEYASCDCYSPDRPIRPPNTTGDTCASCGGMAVRTGTCTTCVECGTTGGCG